MNLRNKTALVTGSGRNIGRAIALDLARHGARVIVNGHTNAEAVDDVVREITEAGGQAIGVMADVSKASEVQALVSRGVAEFGSIDIAVSNVGTRRMQPFLEITPEDWDSVLASNLTASFHLARNVIPHMQRNNWGRIILISGYDGFWGQITLRAHNVTCKAGMHGLSMALAREFGPDGITVNTVVPGAIDTVRDTSQYVHLPKRDELLAQIPVRRLGAPQEIAAACTWLCNDGGGFVSGQAIHVNGGQFMY